MQDMASCEESEVQISSTSHGEHCLPSKEGPDLGDFFKPVRRKYRLKQGGVAPEAHPSSGAVASGADERLEADVKFAVSVSTMTGEILTVEGLQPMDVFGKLRASVAAMVGLLPSEVQLSFGSELIGADHKSLRSYGIHAKSELMLIRVQWQRLLLTMAEGIWIWDLESRDLLRHFRCAESEHDNAAMFANTTQVVSWQSQTDALAYAHMGLGHLRPIAPAGPGELHVWNVDSGKLLQTLTHGGAVNAVSSWSTSSGEEFLITGSSDGTAQLWNLESGEVVQIYAGHTASVTCLATVTLEQDYIVTGSLDTTIRVWEPMSGEEVWCLEHLSSIWSLSVSGSFLAVGSDMGEVWIRDLRTGSYKVGKMEFAHGTFTHASRDEEFEMCLVTHVILSGNRLFTGSRVGRLCLWDVPTGQRICTVDCKGGVSSMAICKDSLVVAFGLLSRDDASVPTLRSSIIRVWDVATGKEVSKIPHQFCTCRRQRPRDHDVGYVERWKFYREVRGVATTRRALMGSATDRYSFHCTDAVGEKATVELL